MRFRRPGAGKSSRIPSAAPPSVPAYVVPDTVSTTEGTHCDLFVVEFIPFGTRITFSFLGGKARSISGSACTPPAAFALGVDYQGTPATRCDMWNLNTLTGEYCSPVSALIFPG